MEKSRVELFELVWSKPMTHLAKELVLEGLKQGDEVVVYSEKPLSSQTRFKVVDALMTKPQT